MTGIRINHPTGPGPAEGEESWNNDEVREAFEFIGFSSPFAVVRRKSDGVKGSLQFANIPDRVYWGFVED